MASTLPGEEPRLRPCDFYAADPDFGRAFAVFLRQNPHLWRVRRVDRFRPQELYLADREISLQGRISPSLVEQFLGTVGADLNFSASVGPIRSGDRMTVLLPVAQRPKRLLLNDIIS